jgi:hypothetical protein
LTVQPQKMHWWYESVIDWMILNPEKTLTDAAEAFDVTTTWIYTLVNSDVFKERLAERREAHSNAISLGVIEKAGALADMALDAALEKFVEQKNSGEMPLSTAVNTAEKAFELVGIGGKAKAPVGNPTFIQNNFVPADQAALQRARAKLLERQQNSTIELPATEIEETS